uniref:Venom serine protease 34 n=2 Tax=Lygus hesperus TaxID=30085 RepID=A0A146LZD5_LYGHE
MGHRILVYLICPVLCLLWSPAASQQQASCFYRQFMEPGRMFSLNNPGYPRPYPGFTSCTWEAYTRQGAAVEVDCRVVNLSKTLFGSCLDYLSVTVDDKPNEYCSPFKVSGTKVKMNLQARTRQGGYFQCTFKATADQTPDTTTNPPNPPSQNCDCGWNKKAPRRRIVGGQETDIHEFPSMAVFVHGSSRSTWCGATIISSRAVLTAAHCTAGNNPSDYGILVGEHDVSKGSETSDTALVWVSQFIIHPDYNPATQANDIALATTEKPIPFNENIGPACLPFNFQTPTMKYLTVAGWGMDEFGGTLSDVLKKVALRIVPNNFCTRVYKHYDPVNQICTFERGKDACQYDSGGPLYDYNSEQKQFLMAVVSYGNDCGRLDPAVNTRVHSYLDWIQSQLPSENFCKKSE